MSIIHDALKKAGHDTTGAAAGSAASAPVERIRKRGSSGWGPPLALFLLLVAGGWLLIPLTSKDRPAGPSGPAAPGVLGQFRIEEARLPAPPPPGTFAVSGVVAGMDGSFGIINGEVVRAGQTVGGAKVVSITGREVQLEHNGETIILPVTERNTL